MTIYDLRPPLRYFMNTSITILTKYTHGPYYISILHGFGVLRAYELMLENGFYGVAIQWFFVIICLAEGTKMYPL